MVAHVYYATKVEKWQSCDTNKFINLLKNS